MLYYLYNSSTDTDKAINDSGLIIPFGDYIIVDSNDISSWMMDSSDLYTAIQAGGGSGAGDQGLTLYDGDPGGTGTAYSVAEGTRRLSLSKDANLVQFDNTTANLPNTPETIQDAIEELDSIVDGLSGTNWKEHVKYRVLDITGSAPAGSEGDFYVNTTNSPDQYFKYSSGSWTLVGNASDDDRVIDLSDTIGTYDERVFEYDATGDSWTAVGENEDNDAIIVDDDGDGKAAMYSYDTTTEAWIKIADVDWGSPDLQSVYDAGDNTVTMAAGGGNVDWDLHDTGTWEVSTGSLFMKLTRATAALNWTAEVSAIDFDTTGIMTLSSGGALTVEAASTVTWSDGTNAWTPQQTGLRLGNYTTAGLPALPGVTGNYGAIAFDTTLDRPVVWVTDSDGGGTDGWSKIITDQDDVGGNIDDAYNAFGANPALVTIDAAESQTTGLEWVVGATNGVSMFISDGANLIARFIADSTVGAADGRVDIGDTAILGLPNKASAPTANNAAGDIYYDSGDGLVYQYDGTRSKWLTVFKQALQFGSPRADGQYLMINGARAAQTGFLMPRDGAITSVTVRTSGGLATKALQVRRNNNAVTPLLSFNLTGGSYTNNSANINFSAGDYLQVFVRPTGIRINHPVAVVEISYRV